MSAAALLAHAVETRYYVSAFTLAGEWCANTYEVVGNHTYFKRAYRGATREAALANALAAQPNAEVLPCT